MKRIPKLTAGCLTLIFLTSLSISCKEEKKVEKQAAPGHVLSLPEDRAGETVRKSIQQAGGWDAWNNLRTLSYTKQIQFAATEDQPAREWVQQHHYRLRPKFQARISWVEDGDSIVVIHDGQKARKIRNDSLLTDQESQHSAWNSSYGSPYVLFMPYKLADPGTVLKYEGIDSLPSGEAVHRLQVTYEKGAGSAGGMHSWWYFFDKDTYEPVANYLNYGDGYSYTEYTSFEESCGLKVNRTRTSYRTNADMELGDPSTEYVNKDFECNKELDDSLFVIPQSGS